MDEYIGIVKLFAGSFAPQNWAFCSGQLLNINQYTALYSILGTTYGGNGTTTFALPNLNGRVAVGAGNGPNPVQPGQVGGSASVTLTTQQMPTHTHGLMVNTGAATTASPAGGVLAAGNWVDPDTGAATPVQSFVATAPNGQASPQAIGAAGSSQPVNVMPPYLGMNYIICLQGLYPSRG